MDFTSGLPSCQGYNTIYTYIDKFIKFVRLIPFKGEGHSGHVNMLIFFCNIVRLFGVKKIVLYGHDSRFTSNFRNALWELLGTKVFFTTIYHP